MAAILLDAIAPGFADPVHDSQAVFRAALEAMAHPGRIVAAGASLGAAEGLLLAFLDQDTQVWLSPAARPLGPWLRFHTGCREVSDPREAGFAYVAQVAELPAISAFRPGTDEDPQDSATVLVEVGALDATGGWTLSGPGIREQQTLHAGGLDEGFAAQWRDQHHGFPRGIDCFLTHGRRLAALPRTTRIREP